VTLSHTKDLLEGVFICTLVKPTRSLNRLRHTTETTAGLSPVNKELRQLYGGAFQKVLKVKHTYLVSRLNFKVEVL
jgi:hypothetical protein